MPNYRRNFVAGGCYFFTVNLLERQRTLLTDHIDLLRDSVRRVRRLHPFHIDAWVVLPDHMHCIWTLPPDTDDFPMRWRLIKLLFSKGLPRTERLSATRKRRAASSLDGACGIQGFEAPIRPYSTSSIRATPRQPVSYHLILSGNINLKA